MKYKYVTSEYLKELELEVERHIELGWEPVGSVTVSHHKITKHYDRVNDYYFHIHHYYIQAMMKSELKNA